MIDRSLSLHLERSWTDRELHFAQTLSKLDPSWGSETFPIADGVAILAGKGLFVNRCFAVGIDGPVLDADLDMFEARFRDHDVPPAIEVSELTEPHFTHQLEQRGYQEHGRTAAVWRRVDDLTDLTDPNPEILIEKVDESSLAVWQETSAQANEIPNAEIRRASDTFALAALHADRPGLLLARSADDGRPMGCASLDADRPVAVLGGMGTVPSERRKGVQAQLLAHRVRTCQSMGCELATSTADADSISERNLIRFGFERAHTKRLMVLEP